MVKGFDWLSQKRVKQKGVISYPDLKFLWDQYANLVMGLHICVKFWLALENG